MAVNPFRIVKKLPASSFLFDTKKEKFIESIQGQKINTDIPKIMLAVFFIHIISGNIIGMVVTLAAYFLIYLFDNEYYQIICTEQRIIINNSYKKIRRVILTIILLITLIIDLAYPFYNRPYEYTDLLYALFIPAGIAGLLNSIYLLFLSQIEDQLTIINAVGSIIIGLWYITTVIHSSNWVISIYHDKVSDAVFSSRKKFKTKSSIVSIIIIGGTFALITFLSDFFPPFVRGGLFTVVVVLSFTFHPSRTMEVTLFSRSGDPIIHPFTVDPIEYIRFQKIIGELFSTNVVKHYRAELPYLLIPKELVSSYQVGRKSVFKKGALTGMYLGAIVYILLLIRLFVFLFQTKPELYREIYIVTILTVFWVGILWIGISNFIEISSTRIQRDQFLIGEEYIGYFKKDTLWILKNDMITGVRLKRSELRKLVRPLRYDKIDGLKLRWLTITTIFLSIFGTIVVFQWVRFGAVNLQGLVLLLLYYAKRSLIRADVFIGTEGALTILFGAISWIAFVFFVPRIIIQSRRKFIIEVNEISSFEFTVGENVQIKQIYNEIERNVLDDVERSPFTYKTRPGTFFCKLSIDINPIPEEGIQATIGSSNISKTLRMKEEEIIVKQKGTKGFVEIPMNFKINEDTVMILLQFDKNEKTCATEKIGTSTISIKGEVIGYRN